MALDRDETGRDRVHGDAERGQFAGPAECQADLCALGGGVGGPARGRPVRDLGVDVHDAAVPPGLHSGQDGAAEQHRALDEEVQLGQVAGPGDLGHRGFGLRAGGVEDQHIDRAEAAGDRGGQPRDLVLIGDVGAEARGGAAVVLDGAADRGYLLVAGAAIDRDGEAVMGQPPRDRRAQAPRAARHQSDTPLRHRHMAMIPPARLAGHPPTTPRQAAPQPAGTDAPPGGQPPPPGTCTQPCPRPITRREQAPPGYTFPAEYLRLTLGVLRLGTSCPARAVRNLRHLRSCLPRRALH